MATDLKEAPKKGTTQEPWLQTFFERMRIKPGVYKFAVVVLFIFSITLWAIIWFSVEITIIKCLARTSFTTSNF
jgi:hypothetical protein